MVAVKRRLEDTATHAPAKHAQIHSSTSLSLSTRRWPAARAVCTRASPRPSAQSQRSFEAAPPRQSPRRPSSMSRSALAKGVLHRRLTTRIFPYTALVCVLTSALWLLWIRRFSVVRVLGASAAVWAGGVLPVLLLRKAYLAVTRTSAASPALLVQKSFAPPLGARSRRTSSPLCVLALHAVLPVFIKSRCAFLPSLSPLSLSLPKATPDRKHPYTPHPVLILLALSQTVLAAL
ncbi:hypothetical protein B0H17DRAFT_1202424 [Mycena rosella]|uniref:Uncharacterized protein n=1 Tax=Mycena rosella TaxID=1033263 RepID=A0AAD7DFW1_MYCRO|nr:hypothetical protein B0H17DRAFT_1202424 [Mycena rosella]